jgi:perosamine synthetase
MDKQQIPLFHAFRNKRMEEVMIDVIQSGQIASGPIVEEFEEQFGLCIDRPNVVATSDMTNAIVIALKLLGISVGDEVAVLAYSCLSTTSAVAVVGATPTWVDINPETMTMCAADLEKKISKKTKAVLLYHIAGYPADTKSIGEICLKYSIPLIEDCNNALGAKVDGEPVGKKGEFAVYSFYPNRQINGFEGGALVCPDRATAARAKRLRRYGIEGSTFRDPSGEINPKSCIPEIGISAPLNQLNAAVALSQINTLDDRRRKTLDNVDRLRAKLRRVGGIDLVEPLTGAIPSYWCLLLHIKNRNKVMRELKNQGIQCSILHYRNDVYDGFCKGREYLPGTTAAGESILAIPCGWWLSEDQCSRIAEILLAQINK